ncbi:MAG: hypothetical protein OIF47_13120 [Marinibacterium sp.]|nr:hypothetical protein [Marinibacterium sp.]
MFYIPGFDPRSPRSYRELYRREGAAQAAIAGYDLSLARNGRAGWQVQGRFGADQVDTLIEVLDWSDIVRDRMGRGIAAHYADLLKTIWIYLATGTFPRLLRLRAGPVIAALYPVLMLLMQMVLAVGAGALLARGLMAVGLIWPLAAVAGAGIGFCALRLGRRWDGRLFAYYLAADYALAGGLRGAMPRDLTRRLQQFADQVATARRAGFDEVLIVGHSTGAHLAVSVLADLLRRDDGARKDETPLGLLTLGQVIPMVACLPGAAGLRADLQYLSRSDAITWVDLSAPGDGCSFALCDPVAVSGLGGAGQRWPLVLSAAFTQTLRPERYQAMRHRYFRLHFQYICAFDHPERYDYFRITAGPAPLAQWAGTRRASPSRILRVAA